MNKAHRTILIVQPCYKNFGGFFRSFAMAKALCKKNNNVTLLISARERTHRSIVSFPVTGLRQIELPRNIFGCNGRFIRALLGCWYVLLNRYDLIICCGITQIESMVPLIFTRMLGKNVVLDRDESWQANFRDSHLFLRLYVWFCEEVLIKLFDTHIVTSDFLYKHSQRTGAKRIVKIINGVELDQFKKVDKEAARKQLGLNYHDKILLSFGNTYENERAKLLFKTFESILTLNPTIKLLFSQNPSDFLNRYPEINKQILKNIIYTGFIDPQQLGLYLGACDIVLFITGNTDNEKACFPIRVGSYLDGERVIATLATDTEWYKTLKQYNCVVAGSDSVDLAGKVVEFLSQREKLSELEDNVRIAKSRLSWSSMVSAIESII